MSGEHPNGRLAMDRLTGHLVKHGVPPKKAEDISRKTALDMDRKGYGKGGK
jgi:hypothetical protein